MDPLPYVSKVYALLIQEEMQRSVTNQSGVKVNSTALVAKMQTFNASITSSGMVSRARTNLFVLIVARLVI